MRYILRMCVRVSLVLHFFFSDFKRFILFHIQACIPCGGIDWNHSNLNQQIIRIYLSKKKITHIYQKIMQNNERWVPAFHFFAREKKQRRKEKKTEEREKKIKKNNLNRNIKYKTSKWNVGIVWLNVQIQWDTVAHYYDLHFLINPEKRCGKRKRGTREEEKERKKTTFEDQIRKNSNRCQFYWATVVW